MAFNKKEYDNNYEKEHYSQFKAKLNKEEKKRNWWVFRKKQFN